MKVQYSWFMLAIEEENHGSNQLAPIANPNKLVQSRIKKMPKHNERTYLNAKNERK